MERREINSEGEERKNNFNLFESVFVLFNRVSVHVCVCASGAR